LDHRFLITCLAYLRHKRLSSKVTLLTKE
jgi:hypothetical protein